MKTQGWHGKGHGGRYGRNIPPLAERLWNLVDGPWVEGIEWDSCWFFTGDWSSKFGYGRIKTGGPNSRSAQAHVVAFEQFWGRLAPEHMVRHACAMAKCCNPFHLSPGTAADNTRDKVDSAFAWASTMLGEPPSWWARLHENS